MISLDDAQAQLIALAQPVSAEDVPLGLALGRYVASDVIALRSQPARDLSAMDGYAICVADGSGPWRLVGESAAGSPFRGSISHGDCVRIFTGAAMPQGTDTVIIQEHVRRDGPMVSLADETPLQRGRNIRLAGSDFQRNDIIIAQGQQLCPVHIGLAALAGHKVLSVFRRIRLTLLSTGDELLALGAPCDEDHIPASNAIMLRALVAALPVDVIDLGLVPDRMNALQTAISEAENADILVTIGGVSVGDHDLVRPALIAVGAQFDFWRVAMRPGKPLLAGTLNGKIVLGLPGNPVSAYVTALLFLKPLIAALSGAANPLPARHHATLGGALPANGDRTDHLRARLSGGVVTALEIQDSASLAAFAQANALIIRPPNAPPAGKGEQVLFFSLDMFQFVA